MKHLRSYLRYRLWFALLAMALVCVALALWVVPSRNQQKAVERVRELGGYVRYDFEPDGKERYRRMVSKHFAMRAGRTVPTFPDPAPSAPTWLVQRLGIDFFASVVEVSLSGTYCRDDDLQLLRHLPKTELIMLRNVSFVTDHGLSHLTGLRQLRTLDLSYNNYEDGGFTDEALRYVATIRSLECISISQNRFTDVGVNRLKELPLLKSLNAQGTQITEAERISMRKQYPSKELSIRTSRW